MMAIKDPAWSDNKKGRKQERRPEGGLQGRPARGGAGGSLSAGAGAAGNEAGGFAEGGAEALSGDGLKEAGALGAGSEKIDPLALKDFSDSNALFEAVIALLGLPEEDVFRKERIFRVLAKEAGRRLSLAIWQNLNPEQAKRLSDYIEQSSVLEPDVPLDVLMIAFLDGFPDLKEKVFKELSLFFKEFVADFRE